jgi:hypothetical protein
MVCQEYTSIGGDQLRLSSGHRTTLQRPSPPQMPPKRTACGTGVAACRWFGRVSTLGRECPTSADRRWVRPRGWLSRLRIVLCAAGSDRRQDRRSDMLWHLRPSAENLCQIRQEGIRLYPTASLNFGPVRYRPSSGNTFVAQCGWHGQTRLPVWPRRNQAKPDRTVKQVRRCHPSRVLPGREPGLNFGCQLGCQLALSFAVRACTYMVYVYCAAD